MHAHLRRSLRAALLAASLVAAPQAARGQLAVIANKSAPVENVTLDQLRRLYLGQASSLPSVGSVVLVAYRHAQPAFARTTLGYPEAVVKQRWVAIVFRGDASAPPLEIESVEELLRFVREHANAIAYLPAESVDATVKTLRVDGKRPSDAGYAVKSSRMS